VTIAVNPILLSAGGLAVRWYGLLALTGLGLAVWLSLRELQRQRLGRRLALDALAWALPAGIIGARAVHVLGDWDYYLTSPGELTQLNLSGLSLWGGLAVGGAIFAARLGRNGGARRRRILDVAVSFGLLGITLGRVGQFLDGAGQGTVTRLPWGTQYSNLLAATPDFGVPRHPAQLYDGLVAMALCGALLGLARIARLRWLPAGSLAASGVVVYSVARLLLGVVRLDPAFVFGLQIEQLLAIGGMLAGASFGLRPLLQAGVLGSRAARDAATSARPQQGAGAGAQTTKDSLAA
jgi:phosphatidylglycerol:prolipoprotein diacylglycerol transferase